MGREKWEQSLEDEILYLISLHQEGGYWDFKKQWHEKKGRLLHDIICMANNLHNRTSYIIIGIDEENGFSAVELKSDPNRKNTQKIVDFLKDKKFAGGIRPLVHVEQFCFYFGDVDVIVIENSCNTPFYLTDSFDEVRANNIYTRIMDSNTPIDKSADINNVEYLWRKRFHLDEAPIDKFRHYLKYAEEWKDIQIDSEENLGGYFYKYAPEYTITCRSDDRDGYEYYIFGQVDTRPSWSLITLRYHQTAISQFVGISLDGGRCFVVAPEREFGLDEIGISCFGFYAEKLRLHLLDFFFKKETSDEYSYKKYIRSILIFKSEQEHKDFVQYIKKNKNHYDRICAQQGEMELPSFPNINGYDMNVFKQEYRDALVMNKMLDEFRSHVKTIRISKNIVDNN